MSGATCDSPRACQAPTASGNPCIGRALAGLDVCAIHSGDDEIKTAHMKALSAKSHAARVARKDDDLTELLAACAFDTLEAIETYLTTMARFAVEKNDPRFLTGAARIVETGRWYLEAKKWQAECLEWRKRNKFKPTAIEEG